MTNLETDLPGPLDVLLRDMHRLWCDEHAVCPADWHLSDADPVQAARALALAIWSLTEHPSDEDRGVLARLSHLAVGFER